jgi:ATP-dependent DNA helicase RecG
VTTGAEQAHVDGGRRLRQLASLPVAVLKRATPKKLADLNALGIHSVLDLVTTYPRRYVDRTRKLDVKSAAIGDEATFLATVTSANSRSLGGRRSVAELTVHDGSGSLAVVFFNQPWRVQQLKSGTLALFFGKVGDFRGTRQMTNPVVDVVAHEGEEVNSDRLLRFVPVYPSSGKVRLTSYDLGQLMGEALRRAGAFADPLPPFLCEELDLIDRTSAMSQIHQPSSEHEADAARRRLAFDELLRLQLALGLRRAVLQRSARGFTHLPIDLETSTRKHASLVSQLLDQLPFPLTNAQVRVLGDVSSDLSRPLPMHRLLQGDVGSGKTIIALFALLAVADGRSQGALMVPTEVLAEQHAQSLRTLVAGLVHEDGRPFCLELLTGRTRVAERRRILEGLSTGTVDVVVGTHALLTSDVAFKELGLAVIDEQHRFGVEQRAALKDRLGQGRDPDLLVMTATPIPRTAAMVLFGDLDVSVLDELPPGRTPITTLWARTDLEELAAWSAVRQAIDRGEQAYVVCPLVEDSDRVAASAATQVVDELSATHLSGLTLGLVHGQMKADQRRQTMEAFRNREVQVLIATTVIEVGIDVPNATVMVIMDSAHFGIAQLHQLRGRVGRGALASTCFLLGEARTEDARTRLEAMEATTDGFALAEVDLQLRGEGTILGARQKGTSDLRLASLATDEDLLVLARDVAMRLLTDHPFLRGLEVMSEELRLLLDEDEAEFLFKS